MKIIANYYGCKPHIEQRKIAHNLPQRNGLTTFKHLIDIQHSEEKAT